MRRTLRETFPLLSHVARRRGRTSVQARTRNARERRAEHTRHPARPGKHSRSDRGSRRQRQRRHPPPPFVTFLLCHMDRRRASANARAVAACTRLRLPDGRRSTELRSIVYFRQCARAPGAHEVARLARGYDRCEECEEVTARRRRSPQLPLRPAAARDIFSSIVFLDFLTNERLSISMAHDLTRFGKD